MLTVKTYLAPSTIHGIGLFAGEDIPIGTQVWMYHPFVDKTLSGKDFFKTCMKLNTYSLQHFLNSTYKRGNRYFYLTDNARFINHSDKLSNIAFINDFSEASLRDICCGEELLENYNLSYDEDDFFFTEQYNPDPQFYLEKKRGNLHVES